MRRLFFALTFAAITASLPVLAQQRGLTAADYARAERFMSYNTTPLVLRSGVRPNWLDDGRFWYRVTTEKGSEPFLVDPVKGTKVACELPQCRSPPLTADGPPSFGSTTSGSVRSRVGRKHS